MAATDQPYRSQRTLDIVFAVTCILMLVSVIVMFAQDYYRPFKQVQREFRDVEATLFERVMLEKLPDDKTLKALEQAEDKLAAARKAVRDEEEKVQGDIRKLRVERVRLEADLQSLKATYDSLASLRNIDADEGHTEARKAKEAELRRLEGEMRKKQDELDETKKKIHDKQEPVRNREQEQAQDLYRWLVENNLAPPARIEDIKNLSQCEDPIRKTTADLDRFAKVTAQKRWGWGDWFRSLPVIDGFASPYQIQQFTLDRLPIDYNFKHVTRYDRCHTCHLGIDRASFDKDTLKRLKDAPGDLQGKLDKARALYQRRQERGESLGFDLGDLPKKVRDQKLSDAQVTQFAAHPRLDLFVDSNSPHAAEKFGCTICHSGQGSATEFNLAAHSPNDTPQQRKWADEHHWHASHYWDFPMFPNRFVESSCLKCHHEVTDLIRYGSRVEAPKLVKGYNLVRENGCFGCHEIAGTKGGRPVGPDLRLEPSPPLEALTPAERTRMQADALNPPGKLRKVGPSLYRLAEKTNEDWTRQWIQSPRDFRPDTRMPHFYGLSNNDQEALKGTDQKDFPAAEIHAITHYLFRESRAYLEGKDKYREVNEARRKELQGKRDDKTISERERKELIEAERRLELAQKPDPLWKMDGMKVTDLRLTDGEGSLVSQLPAQAKGPELDEGARLFREKGCLACHSHDGTDTPLKDKQGAIPPVLSDADFGPNLSRLAAKIAPAQGGAETRRAWLVQWIMNPNIHFPRTRMPITHLSVEEAARVADWLLSQRTDWKGPAVGSPGSETLVELARVYLAKAPGMTREQAERFLREGIPEGWFRDRGLPLDNDERTLQGGPPDDDKLKYYIGKKAINRLGCYGCHSIPGFEFAKPVGTPLNDWGKKDPERLAFEDAAAFVRSHFNFKDVLQRDDPKQWKVEKGKDGKELMPYERYFYDSLDHHQRDGFLHLKLVVPRSFDHNRVLKWDDRLRMPQFQFARVKKRPGEDDQAFQLRASREEAEAREAVMTFVLGLVAEPVPLAYLNTPGPDRLAEARGRHVLEKFNCGGCHQVQSGVYDFKLTKGPPSQVLEQLMNAHRTYSDTKGSDYDFRGNAWVGQLSPDPERVRLHAVPRGAPDPEGKQLSVWLTQAVRFKDRSGTALDLPAGEEVFDLPTRDLLNGSPPYGGDFTDLMVPYLRGRNPTLFDKDDTARAGLPPPLLREGERVQPGWLYRFLLNPGKVRPQVADGDGFLILRMPRFNMSENDAQALVDYFAASDRLANPAYGLTYPYLGIPQQKEEFWRKHSREYAAEFEAAGEAAKKTRALEPIWKQYRQSLDEQLKEAQAALTSAEAEVQKAKEALDKADKDKKAQANDALTRAVTNRDSLKNLAEQLKARSESATPEHLDKEWKTSQVYAADAFRLLMRGPPCMTCHQAGGFGQAAKGPPLDLTEERLRPEWTERWIANPRRLYTYQPAMPANLPRNEKQYQELFKGTPAEQVGALTDLLMDLRRQTALPVNRYFLTSPGGN